MGNESADYFLSCDWGTSTFRLRQVDNSTGRVLWSVCSSDGIRGIYQEAVRCKELTQESRAHRFESVLLRFLEAFEREVGAPSQGIDLVVSGMISSTIGWKELPYCSIPLDCSEPGLMSAELHWSGLSWLKRTWLLSGAASLDDMVRGEETELLGLISLFRGDRKDTDGIWIFPGTHSKHMQVTGGKLTGIRTFMTGELYDVLGRHSILQATMLGHGSETTGMVGENPEEDEKQFELGVLSSRERGIQAGLFKVRTRVVLGQARATFNHSFLSGLLIGSEVLELSRYLNIGAVRIAASGMLAKRYAVAMQLLHPQLAYGCLVDSNLVNRAVVEGQRLWLRRINIKP